MITPVSQLSARLRAARRSHCHTCGCSRCHRIDELLHEASQAVDAHPAVDGHWLIEGRLLPNGQGGWMLQSDESRIPLGDALASWAGYHLVILVGAESLANAPTARRPTDD